MITAVLVAAMLQTAAINNQRDAFMSCLEKARATAKTEKIPAEGFDAYARQNCSAIAETFKNALVAFDTKNKVPRKQALSDAQVQIDDFVSGEATLYKRTAPKLQPAAQPASAPTSPPQASSPNK